jgi:hypothetical protein
MLSQAFTTVVKILYLQRVAKAVSPCKITGERILAEYRAALGLSLLFQVMIRSPMKVYSSSSREELFSEVHSNSRGPEADTAPTLL